MSRYEYDVMPGEDWYKQWGNPECLNYNEAARTAAEMWQAGVRDIVINVYDNQADELANFFYAVDDNTGAVAKH